MMLYIEDRVKMKISIIVAVYNIELYIGRCIDSILEQTYSQFEVILVDDGSTDGSSAICDFYKQRDDRIKVIHKANGGLVSARKAGLTAAQGEYVGFIDGDDWIEPKMYEHMVRLVQEHQADMVMGGSVEDVDGQTVNKINRIKAGVYNKERLCKEVYPYMLCTDIFFSMGIQPYIWNKLMRRELAQEFVSTVDDRIRVGEDVAVIMPMLLRADKVVISDKCRYHYCIRRTSMMWQKEEEEREWEELCILHKFLRKAFSIYQGKYQLESQLDYYEVMNMLTRTYGRIAQREIDGNLWPFNYKIGTGKCIVYGAGNFGRAVYSYLQRLYPGKVCMWVDSNFYRYQLMELPVDRVEEIIEKQEMDILIAVLDSDLIGLIKKNLMELGIGEKWIYSIEVELIENAFLRRLT